MAVSSNNTAVAVKKQAVEGTFDAPSSSTDMLPVSQLRLQIDGVTIANDEYSGSPIKQGDTVAGKRVTLSYRIKVRAPGGADVPAADEFIAGRVLQAFKMTEVINASAIPAAPEAIGGTASAIALALGTTAAGTADLYKAWPLLLSDKGTGFKAQLTAIRSYAADKTANLVETLASAPAANYQLPKFLGYMRSVTSDDPAKLSQSVWLGGMRYDLVDCSGTAFQLVVPVSTRQQAQYPEYQVSFDATIDDYVKEAAPSVPSLGAIPLFRDGEQHLSLVEVGGQNFTVDLGVQSEFPPNPNKTDGSDAAVLTGSTAKLSMQRQFYAKDILDTLALADAQAQHPFYAMWGTDSGSLIQIVIPDARFNYQSPDLGGATVAESGELFIDALDRGFSILFPYSG